MAQLAITKKQEYWILAAAEDGDDVTLARLVREVAEKSNTTEGAVLATVRCEEHGSTALHLAVENGRSLEYYVDRDDKMFPGQLSLNYGLFNQRDAHGRNALMLACKHNCVQYLEFIIGMRGLVTGVDYLGWSAIHYAARANADKVITYLVNEHGLAPDAPGYLGKTPAHVAATKDKLEAFKALFLAQGGCEMPPDHDGFTPIDVAFRSGSANIIRYFYKLGMGTGRAVPEAVEKQALRKMKEVWEQNPGWNIVQEWLEGVPDGRPRKVNLRREWEEEQFPDQQAKRRRLE